MYYERIIDRYLNEWAARPVHNPILLRGATSCLVSLCLLRQKYRTADI